MIGSETRLSFPPLPPPPAPKRPNVAALVGAVAGVVVLVGLIWLVSSVGNPEREETEEPDARRSTTVATSPSPVTSPTPAIDSARVEAVIADAHSGKYFTNDHRDLFPRAAEVYMAQDVITRADADPTITDAFLACTLSSIETHTTFMRFVDHPRLVERLGTESWYACLDYVNI